MSMNKRQQARNEKTLQELIKTVLGNDRCADCGTRGPVWASWSLGVFLCVRCASLHRKLGTHISKVKSISMDTWTTDQVENMRKNGNVKVNALYNPDPTKNPPPLTTEEGDSSLERYIRRKYQHKDFMRKDTDGHASKPSSTSSSGTSSFGGSVGSSSTATATADSGKKHRSVSAGFGGRLFGRSSSSHRESKANQVLGANAYLDPGDTKSRRKSSLPPPGSGPNALPLLHGMVTLPPEEKYEEQLKHLRDMGYLDQKRNIEILQQHNGNILKTVETLIVLSRSDAPPPAPAKDRSQSTAGATIIRKDLSNPFEALDREEAAQRKLSAPVIPTMSAHTTGSNSPYLPQNGFIPPQQQPQPLQPLQVHHTGYPLPQHQPQYVQSHSTGYSLPPKPYQQPQQPFNFAALTQALPAATNPFQQQQQQQYAATAPATPVYPTNPFLSAQNTGQQSTNPYSSARPISPLNTQYTGQPPSAPYTAPLPTNQFTPQPFPQQQQGIPPQFTGQPFSQPFQSQQQQYGQPQQQQQQQYQPVDKNSILALYSIPQLAPQPPQNQIPVTAGQQQQQQQQAQQPQPPAVGSRNPFAQTNKRQEEMSGRCSPDAFAGLAFGVGG